MLSHILVLLTVSLPVLLIDNSKNHPIIGCSSRPWASDGQVADGRVAGHDERLCDEVMCVFCLNCTRQKYFATDTQGSSLHNRAKGNI